MRRLAFLACIALALPTAANAAHFETVYTFSGGADGAHPTYGLTNYFEGQIFGTTRGGDTQQSFGTVFRLIPPTTPGAAWTRETVWTFAGGQDGAYPVGKILVPTNFGDIMGTTVGGDVADDFGTLFLLQRPRKDGKPWRERIIHRFEGGADSGHPNGALYFDVGLYEVIGMSYGNTQSGDYGAIWSWASPKQNGKQWIKRDQYNFTASGGIGAYPLGALQQSGDSRIFGVTEGGGDAGAGCVVLEVSGCGTVFSFDRNSQTVTTAYQSPGAPDPSHFGYGGAQLDTGYKLFGVSSAGNPQCKHAPSCGYLFTMDVQHGSAPRVVHAFSGKDGAGAMSRPVYSGSDQAFIYGSTDVGGTGPCKLDGKRVGCGVVYKVENRGGWKFTILHDFQGGADGANPREILATDDGSIFGETENGGANGLGTVFRISNP